jgi:hypothetical protein
VKLKALSLLELRATKATRLRVCNRNRGRNPFVSETLLQTANDELAAPFGI